MEHIPLRQITTTHPSLIQLKTIADNDPVAQLPLREVSNAYTGTIYIEDQPIDCIFDTGSTNTWIYSQISEFTPIEYSCAIQFGSGTLEGQFGYSDIWVGELLMKDQFFGKVRKTEVFDDSFCCIVGLAYPSMKAGSSWHVPFFDSLMKNHGITSFTFDLDTPTLQFNPDLTGKEVAWNPVVNKLFWSLALDKVTLEYKGEKVVLCEDKQCWVTPDSGSSALTAPTWAHNQMSQLWFDEGSECD